MKKLTITVRFQGDGGDYTESSKDVIFPSTPTEEDLEVHASIVSKILVKKVGI